MIFVSSPDWQSETGNFFGDHILSFRIPLLTTHRIPAARPSRGVSPAHVGEAEKAGRTRPLVAQRYENGMGRACLLCPGSSDINLFRYGKGIIDLNAEVRDGAFDLPVPKQELHCAQIAGTPVDQGCLCSP
jgi:hypothetical protein